MVVKFFNFELGVRGVERAADVLHRFSRVLTALEEPLSVVQILLRHLALNIAFERELAEFLERLERTLR